MQNVRPLRVVRMVKQHFVQVSPIRRNTMKQETYYDIVVIGGGPACSTNGNVARVADSVTQEAHDSAMAAGHYMLWGDFFENYKKYDDFFRLLEDPKQFQRYKKFVIDRKDFVKPSCHARWEDVFRDMVARDSERNATSEALEPDASPMLAVELIAAFRGLKRPVGASSL
jgi:hypothetical protein